MKYLNKEEAITKLSRLISEIDILKSGSSGSNDFTKWLRNTEVALNNIFGRNSSAIGDFKKITYSLPSFTETTPDSAFEEAYKSGLETARATLLSMAEEIKEYWDEENPQSKISNTVNPNGKKIFIVHGHDSGLKEEVARFITKIGFEPIILHEQPSGGKTIIEKFEKNSDVVFAIALLTPDDIGGLKEEFQKLKPRPRQNILIELGYFIDRIFGREKEKLHNMKLRARQNVLFEFGYFIGKLGRCRVCGLKKDEIEIPSDYSGVLYLKYDTLEAWKLKMIIEMNEAGLDVDANSLLA